MLSYQIVIRLDPEKLPEVAECHRCVGLEAEVGVMVSRGEVAPLAATESQAEIINDLKNSFKSKGLHFIPEPARLINALRAYFSFFRSQLQYMTPLCIYRLDKPVLCCTSEWECRPISVSLTRCLVLSFDLGRGWTPFFFAQEKKVDSHYTRCVTQV